MLTGTVLALLLCGAPTAALPQEAPAEKPAEKPAENQYFAGIVTACSDTSLTVNRTVLGKDSSTRTFAITPETRIDGKPKVKTRVTVQFVSGEEGDRAVHIIVRTPQQQHKKPGESR